MKKLICLALVLALTAAALSGCSLRFRKASDAAPDAADATAANEGNYAPEGGPGYVITDGSTDLSGADDTASEAALDAGLGAAQPTAEPVETLPPEGASGGDEAAEGNGDEDGMANIVADDGTVFGTYDESTDAERHVVTSNVIDTNAYQYSAVVDNNIDYTFNYPSQWENVPGIYTVCFREVVEPGEFPARVAITRKRLVHTPDQSALLAQLRSYMIAIYHQYDASTFQVGNVEITEFMGANALCNTYLAYWGDTEVKGYIVGCAIERTMYVFHFCASYSHYVELENVMQYIRNSVKHK